MTLFEVESEGEACGWEQPIGEPPMDPSRSVATGEGTPTYERPSGSTPALYHSPRGIFPHQVSGVAHVLAQVEHLVPSTFAVWDTGLGKTHLDMISTAMIVEDPSIPLHIALVACESDKVDEWIEDFKTFTRLKVVKYVGLEPAKRKVILDHLDAWDVLVSTYETFRNDMVEKVQEPNAKGRMVEKLHPGMLTKACAGRLVKVTWDEVNKLGDRNSGNHKAQDLFIKTVNQTGGQVITLALSATPIDTGPDDAYNVGRLLAPDRMPTVHDFETRYVATKNFFGEYDRFKNLTPDKMTPVFDSKTRAPVDVPPFRDLFSDIIIRKSKNDADVRDFFPPTTEEWTYLHLGERHQAFYNTVVETFEGCDPITERALFNVLRMIAGHPLSLLNTQGQVARTIVDTVGVQGLQALGSAKLDRVVRYLVPVVKSGQQAILFTFFGPSMGPLICEALHKAGIETASFYGSDRTARAAEKERFKAGDARVLVSSDAGSKGLNLPQATYVTNYELPLTHSRYIQRANRSSRLGEPGQPLLTIQSFIATGTVEDGVVTLGHRRNEWSDQLYETEADEHEDDRFLSAKQRKQLIAWSKKKASA